MEAVLNPKNPFTLIFLCLLLAAIVVSFGTMIPSLIPSPSPIGQPYTYHTLQVELGTDYAGVRVFQIVDGHPATHDALNAALACLMNNGTWKSFKTKPILDPLTKRVAPRNVWMCYDPKTDIYYAIVSTIFELIDGNPVARLVSVYPVDKVRFATIALFIEYLETKWGATIINYVISAEYIILEPIAPSAIK